MVGLWDVTTTPSSELSLEGLFIMFVLGLQGSPRKNGNTSVLLASLTLTAVC